MREFTTPLLVEASGHRNATELLLQRFHTSPTMWPSKYVPRTPRSRNRGGR